MYIFLVRHGETDWNKKRLAQGREDIELNENGIAQAEMLCGAFSGVAFDAVASSPLKRAYKTAQIISQNRNLEIIIEPDLIERDYGQLSGTLVKAEDRQKFFMDMDIPGLEPMSQVAHRMLSVLKKYAASSKKSVLMVSHGAAINSVLSVLSDSEVGSGKTWLKNSCICIFEGDAENINIKEYNLDYLQFQNLCQEGKL